MGLVPQNVHGSKGGKYHAPHWGHTPEIKNLPRKYKGEKNGTKRMRVKANFKRARVMH